MSIDEIEDYLTGKWIIKEYHCWERFTDTIIRIVEINKKAYHEISIYNNDTIENIYGQLTLFYRF